MEWLSLRRDLALRTRELYQQLLDRHIVPLGSNNLVALAPSKIRSWHVGLAADHASTAAKAYRLLSTILHTAVADGLILASPCKVNGAGVERAAEQPVATVREVAELEAALPEHLRLIVPLATWCQLRRAELLGLRRQDIDLELGVLRIEQSRTYTMHGKTLVKEPKTAAGRRTIAIPDFVLPAFKSHSERFTGKTGVPLGANVLQVAWQRARVRVGRTDLRLHDLRHTGLTMAAATGATTVELMHRAGHSSAVAAMRYQHATRHRDCLIAEALGRLVASSAESAR